MQDIATLGLEIDSSGAVAGTKDLDKLTVAATRAEKASADLGTAFQDTGKKIDQAGSGAADMAKRIEEAGRRVVDSANRQVDAGRKVVTQSERIDQAGKAAAAQMNATAQASALNRAQLQNLGYQLNDIATMLLSGSSPFQVMATQGGQVAQVLQSAQGGIGGALKDLGGRLMGLLTPARLAGAAVAGIATAGYAAWSAWDDKIKALALSLNGVGRASGQTVDSLAQMAARSGNGLSTGQNMGLVGGFAASGLGGDTIAGLTSSTKRFAQAFQLSVSDAAAELARAFEDPAKGAEDLNKRFGFLTHSMQEAIRQQQASGNLEGARAMLMQEYNTALGQTTTRTNALSSAFDKVTTLFSNMWNKLGQTFASPTAQDRLEGAFGRQSRRGVFTLDPAGRNANVGANIMKAWEEATDEVGRALIAQQQIEKNRLSFIEAATQRMREDGDLVIQSINARSLAERAAVDAERARLQVLRQTGDVTQAALAAEQARAQAIADANRQLRDAVRDSKNQLELAGLRPFERMITEIKQQSQDMRERLTGAGGTTAAPAVRGAAGLNHDFMQNLARLIAAVPGITIASGLRTNAEQAALYAAKPHLAAPPGRSNHEYGLAADLAFSSANARAEAHRRAGEFGLSFPMKDRARNPEPWHVEPIGARAMRGAPPLTIGGQDPVKINEAQKLQAGYIAATIGPLREANDNIDAQNRLLDIQQRTMGKTTSEIEAANEAQRLYSQLAREGLTEANVTANFGAEAWMKIAEGVRQTAQAAGDLAARKEAFAQLIQTMDGIRSAAGGFLSTFTSGITSGKSAIESLKGALSNLASQMLQMAQNQLITSLFGKSGTAGGGLLGDLLGSFGIGGGGGYADLGGGVRGYAVGGMVNGPGSSTSDSIIARLSKGEFVTNADSTRKFYPLLKAINENRLPGFADGGLVGQSNRGQSSGSGAGTTMNVIIENHGGDVQQRQEKGPDGMPQLRVIFRQLMLEDVQRNGPVAQGLQARYQLNRSGGRR